MATKKAKKKASKKSSKAHKTRKSRPKKEPASAVVVYVLLGLVVIATSFYAGYLFGQSDGGMTKTGNTQQGELTVIEYSDFECPFCSRAAPTVEQLKAEYPNVKVEYKHFPLESIHPNAFNAAVASECVRNEGGDDAFWDYHDVLFANQQALDAASLKSYATDLGFDISSCLDNQETADTVREHMAEASSRGVRGTPSFWIGDELVVGALPFEQIKAKVDEKLSDEAAPAAPAQPSAPAAPAAPSAPVDVAGGSFYMGDADAPVELVEFTDYQCPFCKRAHDQSFPDILSNYIETGKVKYTVRHFPLPFHGDAKKASEGVECAGKLGGADSFWAFHEKLFENQQALKVDDLKGYAAELGLDADGFASCLDSGEFSQKVDDDMAAGRAAGVSGTPSFFVNGNNVVGAQPFSVFQAAIEAELQ